MIRIVGGKHRGKMISVPEGNFTRPTTNRVRESLFNILESKSLLHGVSVLDGCAGSGSLGLEALSRGANHATFLDVNKQALKTLEQNISFLKEDKSTNIYLADVTDPPKNKRKEVCSIVFLDAPYNSDVPIKALSALIDKSWIQKGSLIIIECAKHTALRENTNLKEIDFRAYGSTELHFLEYCPTL